MSWLWVNLALALLWMVLSGRATLVSFGLGYALGLVLLALLRPVFPRSRYVPRVLAALRFGILFLAELARANLLVARTALFGRKQDLWPNFLTYDVTGLSRTEVFILSHCITLTPGTTTVDVSEDFTTLVLHALDARDPDAVRSTIDRRLKAPLLAFTRG